MPRGGYQKPSKPAAVSGPGKYSQRTDGQPIREMTGGPYGEASEMRDLQASAPMSDTQGLPPPPEFASEGVVGLGEPTQFPDQPVTAGAPVGEGPGPEILGLQPNPMKDVEAVKKFLPLIAPWVDAPETPDSVRQLFKFVRDN